MQKIKIGIYGIALLVGGLFILVVGSQRLAAALLSLPADEVKQRIGDGDTISIAELTRTVEALNQADGWHHHPRHQTDKALMELILYEQHRLPRKEAAAALGRARRDLGNALKESPLDPYAWARLAYLFTLSPGPSFASAKALQRSYLSGPMDRQLTMTRFELAMANWDVLDDTTRSLAEHEAKLMWQGNSLRRHAYTEARRALVGSSVKFGKQDWLRSLVATSPKDMKAFDTMLRQEANKPSAARRIRSQEQRP